MECPWPKNGRKKISHQDNLVVHATWLFGKRTPLGLDRTFFAYLCYKRADILGHPLQTSYLTFSIGLR